MKESKDKIAAFILTHGRPNKVTTYNSLLRCGFTGDIYLIIDNEDESGDEYRRKYGDKVIVFDKAEIAKKIDEGDNFESRKTIIYARNASFEIAKRLGVKYFIQLDDDYSTFIYKFDSEMNFMEREIKDMDRVFDSFLNYYKSIDALSIAFAQNGDFIGGSNGSFAKVIKPRRKCMNTFICSTDRPFKFFGRINEDVNTYTKLGNKGKLFLTVPNISIIQGTTQANKGGMSETYLDQGTYVKSFYSVMYMPSCVTVTMMGEKHKRLHHRISWNNCVPAIIDEKYVK